MKNRTIVIILLLLCIALPAPLLQSMLTGARPNITHERFPIQGLDISAHNGMDIDFRSIKEQGYSFVIFKASEGSSFKDRRFFTNIAHARRAGLKVGAYHFFRFDATGYMQALNFLHSLRGQQLDLPVVVDLEDWTNPLETTRYVLKVLDSFISRLELEGYSVMLYTNKDGYEKYLAGRYDHYPLWIASMTEFSEPKGWTIWQYSHNGRVDGVDGAVDLNVYNGTAESWREWCATIKGGRDAIK